jgi:hypothetical protein
MQNAGRIGGVLGDKTVVNLGCEEKIPPDWLLTALRKKGIRPDWILTGQGARMLQSCDGMGMVVPLHVPILEIRPPEECTMEELMVEIFRRASKTINKNKLH